MNFRSEWNFQPVKGKAMAQSYCDGFVRLHWTYSMSNVIFRLIIKNPWAKSKQHIFKPVLQISSETNKLQQALVTFPWSNHPKERINVDKITQYIRSLLSSTLMLIRALTRWKMIGWCWQVNNSERGFPYLKRSFRHLLESTGYLSSYQNFFNFCAQQKTNTCSKR